MIQKISAPVSVQVVYDHRRHTVSPKQLFWDGRHFFVTNIGFHHVYRSGQTLFHIYSVTSNNISFRLKLNTDNLFWLLEEISDGLAN